MRKLRETLGITQKELAERSELSVDLVGKMVHGTTSPTVASLAQVARGLGVEMRNLLDLCEEDTLSEDPMTALGEVSRYLRDRNTDDVRFALSMIRQILERR